MKNPWMSAWLSGANAIAGRARGVWMREARKQQSKAATDARKRIAAFWGLASKKRRRS